MKKFSGFKVLAAFSVSLLLLTSGSVHAEEYEELRYEDLVQQLSQKREPVFKPASIDSVMIHAGFGLVSSSNQIRYPSEIRSRPLNGFQLSLGVDLLSDQFLGEWVFRNFANHQSGNETRSSRESDWRIVYRQKTSDKVETRFGMGFGSRLYRLNDPALGYTFEQETPMGLLSAGLEIQMSRNLSLGIETGIRSALVTNTTDINSVDATMRMESRF